jgi:hypothetical protein
VTNHTKSLYRKNALISIPLGAIREFSRHLAVKRVAGVGAQSAGISPSEIDKQYEACISEVLLGPRKTTLLASPEGTRNEDGVLIHGDILMAEAPPAEADLLESRAHAPATVMSSKDPLEDRSRFYRRVERPIRICGEAPFREPTTNCIPTQVHSGNSLPCEICSVLPNSVCKLPGYWFSRGRFHAWWLEGPSWNELM